MVRIATGAGSPPMPPGGGGRGDDGHDDWDYLEDFEPKKNANGSLYPDKTDIGKYRPPEKDSDKYKPLGKDEKPGYNSNLRDYLSGKYDLDYYDSDRYGGKK
jgi:hypothetical protein